MTPFVKFLSNFHSCPTLGTVGDPTSEKFDYPSEKRRTKQNVERMRQSEQNLEKFWAVVDRYYASGGLTQHEYLH